MSDDTQCDAEENIPNDNPSNHNPGRLLVGLGLCMIAGGWFFNVSGFGLNLLAFSVVLGVAFLFVHRPARPSNRNAVLLAVAFLFIASFAWREALVLLWLNGAALVCLLLIAISQRKSDSKVFYLTDFFSALGCVRHKLFTSAFRVAKRDVVLVIRKSTLRCKLGAIFRGLLFSVPFVIIAGSLLASADMKFSNFLDGLFTFNFDFPSYFMPMVFSVLIAAAFLTRTHVRKSSDWYHAIDTSWHLGEVEINTVLTAINSVFALYIYVQIGDYFSDDVTVRNTHGFVYSRYARDGFFELFTLSCVSLGFLWLLEWSNRKENRPDSRWFRFMAFSMISLLFVIEASAIHRMLLYTNAYGVTETRFYVTALMFWISVVFVIFMSTVLRARPERFLARSLYCGMALVLTLNLLNPSAWIASYNIQHADKISLDSRYLTQLGYDAYPTILSNLKSIPRHKRCEIVAEARRGLKLSDADWRLWSWGKYQTRQALMTSAGQCSKP